MPPMVCPYPREGGKGLGKGCVYADGMLGPKEVSILRVSSVWALYRYSIWLPLLIWASQTLTFWGRLAGPVLLP